MRVFELGVEAHPEFRLPGYWLEEGRCWIYLGWGQLDKALRHAKTNLEARKRFDPAGTPVSYTHLDVYKRQRGRKGAFLVAPAGYGKTSLLLQALRAAGIPIVWYRLDAHDNDLCVFVRHLEAGLKKRLGSSDHEMPGLRKAKSVADSSVVEQSVVKQSAEGQSVEERSVCLLYTSRCV